MEKVTNNTTHIAAWSTILAGFTLNDFAIVVGIVVTIATFLVNLWFQADRRKREIASQKG